MADYKNFMPHRDEDTENHIAQMLGAPAFIHSKVRVMPDGHDGKGAVVGSTFTFTDKVVPSAVGVDVSCSVSAFAIPPEVDFEKLDKAVHENVPAGQNVHENAAENFDYTRFRCYDAIKDRVEYFDRSIGTLGQGNHFISVECDEATGQNWFLVHCGSRNLGVKVAEHYQALAANERDERVYDIKEAYEEKLAEARAKGRFSEIEGILTARNLDVMREKCDDDLCYVSEQNLEGYLADSKLCHEWVELNHKVIFSNVAKAMGWEEGEHIFVSHNYVDVEHRIVRKGAIAAYEGQLGLVPLNMRDGTLVIRGKGNKDWNCSAPHGAGRALSRNQARNTLKLEDYREQMDGIYTTCVSRDTLDEAPAAYKDAAEIEAAIEPAAEVIAHLVPRYNFKG